MTTCKAGRVLTGALLAGTLSLIAWEQGEAQAPPSTGIRGQVSALRTGSATPSVSNASITFRSEDGSVVRSTLSSVVSGHYSVELEAGHRYSIHATHDHHRPYVSQEAVPVEDGVMKYVQIEMDPTIEEGMHGFVSDTANNRPVSGATLTFLSEDGSIVRSTTTNERGSYRIELEWEPEHAEPPGHPGGAMPYEIRVEHPAYEPIVKKFSAILDNHISRSDIYMGRSRSSDRTTAEDVRTVAIPERHVPVPDRLRQPRIPSDLTSSEGQDVSSEGQPTSPEGQVGGETSIGLPDGLRRPRIPSDVVSSGEEAGGEVSVADRREKAGQIALVQEGRNTGALAYLSYEDAFRGDWGNGNVRDRLYDWIRQGKRIRQIAEVPGQRGVVAVADRNDFFVYPPSGGLERIARELSVIRQADLPIDRIALPPSAATEGHFVAVLGQEVTHRGAPAAARAVETLLARGHTIDAVSFTPSGGWIVVAGDEIRSGGVSANAHVLSVLRNHIGRDRTIQDLSFDPDVFGKPGERGGFAVLTNRRIFALDAGSCRSLKNVRNWSYEKGGRSVICNTTPTQVAAEPTDRRVEARSKEGLIRMKRIYVRESQESTGDEPYLLNFGFRARLGTGRQTAGFRSSGGWKDNIESTNNWAKNGTRRDIPRAVGRHGFSSVEPFELFGIVSLLMEEDLMTSESRMRDFIGRVEGVIRNRLEAEFEGPTPHSRDLTESRSREITEETLEAFVAVLRRLPAELQAIYENHMKGGIGGDTDDFADMDVIAYINAPGLGDREVFSDYVQKYSTPDAVNKVAQRNGTALARPGNFNRWRYCCLSEGFKLTDLNFGVFMEITLPNPPPNYRITGELQLY